MSNSEANRRVVLDAIGRRAVDGEPVVVEVTFTAVVDGAAMLEGDADMVVDLTAHPPHMLNPERVRLPLSKVSRIEERPQDISSIDEGYRQ